ncbi:MAG: Fe-S protein assembly co-chaperone HscB [Acidobacteria bacterium]|nr:Fe-S protein assembly co-chaperone HscB [Acidobacteriota bacterium]
MTEKATTGEKKAVGVRAPGICWSCQAEVSGEHFCPACDKIQPQPPDTDYFCFFGLDRKLALDAAALERRFHDLSWKLHPDNFHAASTYEQELSLEKAAVLNDAYRTLRDPVARVEYLLGLEGIRREGEIKQQAPPDLLAEVFELNEYLEELRAAKRAGGEAREMNELRHRLEQARESFQQKLECVLEELTDQFSRFDAAPESAARKNALQRMSEILNRHSYIRNLVRNVSDELEEE